MPWCFTTTTETLTKTQMSYPLQLRPFLSSSSRETQLHGQPGKLSVVIDRLPLAAFSSLAFSDLWLKYAGHFLFNVDIGTVGMKSAVLLFFCNVQFFCFSSSFFCLIKHLLILHQTPFTFRNTAICCQCLSIICLFPPAGDHWISIHILILLILCLSPYNEILDMSIIHSHLLLLL